jgi:hypothetical protein
LLAVTEFGQVFLYLDTLFLQGFDDAINDILGVRHTDRRVGHAVIHRHELSLGTPRQAELILDGAPMHHSVICQTVAHALQEVPRSGFVRCAVETDVVDKHRSGVWRIGQHRECGRVRHEPQFADAAHLFHRLELVQRIHGP